MDRERTVGLSCENCGLFVVPEATFSRGSHRNSFLWIFQTPPPLFASSPFAAHPPSRAVPRVDTGPDSDLHLAMGNMPAMEACVSVRARAHTHIHAQMHVSTTDYTTHTSCHTLHTPTPHVYHTHHAHAHVHTPHSTHIHFTHYSHTTHHTHPDTAHIHTTPTYTPTPPHSHHTPLYHICTHTTHPRHTHPYVHTPHPHLHTQTPQTPDTPHAQEWTYATHAHPPHTYAIHTYMHTRTHPYTHTVHHMQTHTHTLHTHTRTHTIPHTHMHTYSHTHTPYSCTQTHTAPYTPRVYAHTHTTHMDTRHSHTWGLTLHTTYTSPPSTHTHREKALHKPVAYAEEPGYVLKNFYYTENARRRLESSKKSRGENQPRLSYSWPPKHARAPPGLRSPQQLECLYLHTSTHSHRVPSSPDGIILGNTW